MPWEFERDGEKLEVEPTGPLVASLGNAADVLVAAALAGNGIVYLFEDWLRPHTPAALRAFIDFIGKGRARPKT